MSSNEWYIVIAFALILGVIGWRVKSIVNAANSGLSDEEMAEYQALDLSSKEARANLPSKFQPLRDAARTVSKLYLMAVGIAICTFALIVIA